jgi:Protein of unknown function (DUF4058)
MPMHDWTKVDAGIFHALHHGWIYGLTQSLNYSLPKEYYALQEQHASAVVPDVIALERIESEGEPPTRHGNGIATVRKPRPLTQFVLESSEDVYVQKQNRIAIRHVSGDDLVAVVEILSPGNKASKRAFEQLLEKIENFLDHRIHLLIIDPFPPTSRDPLGIHSAVWQDRAPGAYSFSAGKPLTLVAYECTIVTRAYVEHFGVGDILRSMPVYLERDLYVDAPLEETYQAAFAAMPQRWREVLEAASE